MLHFLGFTLMIWVLEFLALSGSWSFLNISVALTNGVFTTDCPKLCCELHSLHSVSRWWGNVRVDESTASITPPRDISVVQRLQVSDYGYKLHRNGWLSISNWLFCHSWPCTDLHLSHIAFGSIRRVSFLLDTYFKIVLMPGKCQQCLCNIMPS